MKKKVMMCCLFMGVFLLGACQNSDNDTASKSMEQS